MMRRPTLSACLLCCALGAAATSSQAATDEPCMEGATAQFGRYVGDWKITDEQLSPDGKEWKASSGARWIFKCIGDGVAVQDFWHPNTGGWGTNLRTYNEQAGQWDIVWAATGMDGLQRISAREQDDGSIVMTIEHPAPPQPRRIIFFPPDDSGWRWAQQWSLDGGQSWFDVYRIQATPWPE